MQNRDHWVFNFRLHRGDLGVGGVDKVAMLLGVLPGTRITRLEIKGSGSHGGW